MKARAIALDAAHANVLAIVLVGALATALLAVFAPSLIVGDTWMTLVSGREIVTHGLPDVERLTVFGDGRRWTDQQWLAQVVAYGAWRGGGLSLLVLASVASVTLAFSLGVAAARSRGGTALACALVLLPVIVGAPWAWTIRAQVFALPLYVATLWIVVASRRRVTGRTFLALPLLALWANIHGSVVLGAVLVALVGALAVVRRASDGRQRLLGAVLAVGAACSVLVTPYAPGRIVDYYHLFFFDQPFEGLLNEWERTGLSAASTTFWLLATAMLVLCLHERRRLSLVEWLVLAITFVGGVQAIRGIVWFVLAVLVIGPNVLTGLLGARSVLSVRRANIVLAGAVVLGVLVATAGLLSRDDRSLTRIWPSEALPVLARELRDPDLHMWGTDRHADWLLWELPELRGRLAFDVRFELYTRDQVEDIVRWNGRIGPDWKHVADPYRVVLLDTADRLSHLEHLAREPGTRIAYRDDKLIVAVRSG